MRRNSHLAVIAGFALAAILFVAALLLWGATYTHNMVHNQLAAQQIYFPPKAAFAHPQAGTEITPSMIPSVSQYAGQQLVTGQQAQSYADNFIAVHITNIAAARPTPRSWCSATRRPTTTPARQATWSSARSAAGCRRSIPRAAASTSPGGRSPSGLTCRLPVRTAGPQGRDHPRGHPASSPRWMTTGRTHADSRYWGPVKGPSIIGKVVLVLVASIGHPDLRWF